MVREWSSLHRKEKHLAKLCALHPSRGTTGPNPDFPLYIHPERVPNLLCLAKGKACPQLLCISEMNILADSTLKMRTTIIWKLFILMSHQGKYMEELWWLLSSSLVQVLSLAVTLWSFH